MTSCRHLAWAMGFWAMILWTAAATLAPAAELSAVGRKAASKKPASTSKPPATTAQAPSLLRLLKAAEVQYHKLDNNREFYKVLLSLGTDAKVVAVLLSEEELTQSKTKIVELTVLGLEVPEGFRHPPAMLKKIAAINSRIVFGKVCIPEDIGNVYYRSTFLLAAATTQDLVRELDVAFYMHGAIRRELEPFLKE